MKVIIGMMALCLIAHAEDGVRQIATVATSVAPGRYEIVQSAIVARDTFRLDRYTGRVWQFVHDTDKDAMEWQEVLVENPIKLTSQNTPRFQIVMFGIKAADTLLFDVISGRTWQYTNITAEGKHPGAMWLLVDTSAQPMPDHPYAEADKPGELFVPGDPLKFGR
jgi:hypothetical protein